MLGSACHGLISALRPARLCRRERRDRRDNHRFGEGRGFRIVWLLEGMRPPYHLRPFDMLAGVEKDFEFVAIMAGGSFTAADISVTYALEFAERAVRL